MDPKKLTQKRINERGKIAINFDVVPEFHEKLRRLAIEEDRTISNLIRRILGKYLAKLEI